MKQLSFFAVVMIFILSSCTPTNKLLNTSKKPSIKFIENQTYEEVIAKAQASGKPIMIDFYTTWCEPCKWLEQDVFQVKQVYTYYNDNVINYKVNAENFDNIALAQQFEIAAYPTVIFLTQDGDYITRQEGSTTATNFINLGRNAVSTNGNSISLK